MSELTNPGGAGSTLRDQEDVVMTRVDVGTNTTSSGRLEDSSPLANALSGVTDATVKSTASNIIRIDGCLYAFLKNRLLLRDGRRRNSAKRDGQLDSATWESASVLCYGFRLRGVQSQAIG